MLALTLAAFFAVTTHGIVRAVLVPALLVLAAVQVGLQAILFMHLNVSRRMFAGFFAAGAALAVVMAGSLLAILTDTQQNAPVVAAQSVTATSPAPKASSPPRRQHSQPSSSRPPSSTTSTPPKSGKRAPVSKASSAPRTSGTTSSSGVSPTVIKAAVQIVSAHCLVCHTIAGLQPKGTIGPDLNQVMAGKANLVPGGQPTNPAWLAKWLANPPQVWSGAIMPDLGLSSSQVKTLVAYLGTLH